MFEKETITAFFVIKITGILHLKREAWQMRGI